MMAGMVTMTIRIPEELRKELLRISAQQDRSASDLVRESLRRFIASEQLRQIREETRPRAESRGFRTDEDVFKAVS